MDYKAFLQQLVVTKENDRNNRDPKYYDPYDYAHRTYSDAEIKAAEEKMGFGFPEPLKEYYRVVGASSFPFPEKFKEAASFDAYAILPPHVIANFFNGIEFDEEGYHDEEYFMIDETYECLAQGEIAFFEIGDSSSFMTMCLQSNNPNAVWFCENKIEDSFERFIYRLYHEGPRYYIPLL